ncbi:unnamed protein product (macronuclear) [Paramecium tetraurelia]|uniref:VWFA domain-containing protein n=1 Tax=Paramecium tetraurelia TaxID=5888 RepID=A0BIT1_PARTE|nr:uncharacterized protein GSPATT00004820001 [Paramecium tetraurelia]CAK58448.1 unnamed protein product [Paramecium tetraurelia]|eukprot:XP_001425846.1 hypothetical protein (macronuclear) [Paramecium tetraurelia strain d4-2]
MGISCSSQKSARYQKSKQTQQVQITNKGKCLQKVKGSKQKDLFIADDLCVKLSRLDQLHQSPNKLKKNSSISSLFDKQQQFLEWKLECDIAFIIDLTMKENKKRLRLLKELLSEKERHQQRFGIVYFGHNKTQFDLIDDCIETTYDLQRQLQTLKLDEWINIIKSLRNQIVTSKDRQLSQIYILSEQNQENIDQSILDIVDNLLEDTCSRNSLSFQCHSFKIEEQDDIQYMDISFQ